MSSDDKLGPNAGSRSTEAVKSNDDDSITANFTGVTSKQADAATAAKSGNNSGSGSNGAIAGGSGASGASDATASSAEPASAATSESKSKKGGLKNRLYRKSKSPPAAASNTKGAPVTAAPAGGDGDGDGADAASIVTAVSEPTVKSSPLLSSTPPTVSKSLIRAYPYLIYANKTLSVLTWTDDNIYLPIALVLASVLFTLYFEQIVTFFGHLLPVLALAFFPVTCTYVDKQQEEHSTLDDVVQCLSSVSNKSEKLLQPITSLNLTAYDLKRLLFTTIFLSPLYVLVSYFLLSPKSIVLSAEVFLLTYHSTWSRVTRKLLWKSKAVRLLCFYLTGLDFEQQGNQTNTLFNYAVKQTNKTIKGVAQKATGGGKSGPTRFSYVLYENQRRWLGVGWTANLLSYERTPWTDEFLNEADAPESFELPQLDDDSGMYWRWIDKAWRVDLTNDGAIQLPSTKSKTTADPKSDEGWIYYDNTWKSPTTEDSFSKYTRRRRWVRTAELVSASGKPVSVAPADLGLTASDAVASADVSASGDASTSTTSVKKRKSLRFAGGDDNDDSGDHDDGSKDAKAAAAASEGGAKTTGTGSSKTSSSTRSMHSADRISAATVGSQTASTSTHSNPATSSPAPASASSSDPASTGSSGTATSSVPGASNVNSSSASLSGGADKHRRRLFHKDKSA